MSAPERGDRPMLSVVTPVFNSVRFVGETLDSVSALKTPHEHIVIDGGSTDGTVELLSRREDPALVWVSEPDRGQTHAVNKGLDRAGGSLIAWLNADDAYIPENVDQALAVLVENQELDAVFGFEDIVDEEGGLIRQYRCGPFSWRRYLYLGDYLPTPTIIFRRALLERAPRLDERYEYSADCDFYLRLLRGAKVRRVRTSLVRFRYHAASKTAASADLQQRDGLEIRLRYARSALGRSLIRAVSKAKLAREAVAPSWPEIREQR